MCIVSFLLLCTTMLAIAAVTGLSMLRRPDHQKTNKTSNTRSQAAYDCIYIQQEDILNYGRLEMTCQLQMRGRLGTKRLIVTDEKMKPLHLFLRMSWNRDWYRLDISPRMHHQAKVIDDDSDMEDGATQIRFKLTRCRQTEIVEDILTAASEKETSAYYLITQRQISQLGDLFGDGVRLKRRRLMAVLNEADGI